MDREDCLKIGIDFRNGKYPKDTWESLNKKLGKPFCSGEAFRSFVKQKLKKDDKLPKAVEIKNSEIENKLSQLEIKTLELKKERIKNSDLTARLNKLIREEAREEHIIEELKHHIDTVIPPKFERLPVKKNEQGYLLSFGDIHFGKKFKSLTNEYSEEIAIQRMNQLLAETIELCKRENISHLNITNGGDSVDGLIHANQLLTIQTSLVESTIRFARMMVEWLNELSKYVEVTYYHVPMSNHTQLRVLYTSKGELPKEDLEKVIINYIHDMLKNNPRIKIPMFEHDFIEFNICGYEFVANHGHQVKNVNSFLKDMSNFRRKFYDFYISAHKHHGEETTLCEGYDNNCELLLIPSIMGSDEYSDSLLLGGKAGAKLFIFEKGKGKTVTFSIKLN